MAYLTIQDMIDHFGDQELTEITNLYDPSADEPNTTRLQKAIDYAESEVNSYLSGRYDLPFLTVPLVLTNKTIDIARYHLEYHQPREDVRRRYDDAIKWLEQCANGKINLGLDDTGVEVTQANDGIAYNASDRVFTRSSLQGYTDIWNY